MPLFLTEATLSNVFSGLHNLGLTAMPGIEHGSSTDRFATLDAWQNALNTSSVNTETLFKRLLDNADLDEMYMYKHGSVHPLESWSHKFLWDLHLPALKSVYPTESQWVGGGYSTRRKSTRRKSTRRKSTRRRLSKRKKTRRRLIKRKSIKRKSTRRKKTRRRR